MPSTMKQKMRKCLNPCFNGSITLTGGMQFVMLVCDGSLNPCFNGSITLTTKHLILSNTGFRLNPCFNGSITLT